MSVPDGSSEPPEPSAPSRESEADSIESTDMSERVGLNESAEPAERAAETESAVQAERAEKMESTAQGERAATGESSVSIESAGLAESTVPSERAVLSEGTEPRERSGVNESTETPERAVPGESTAWPELAHDPESTEEQPLVDEEQPIDFEGPWKPEWKRRFLQALRAMPNVTRAAKHAGVTRQAAQYQRKRDPKFSAAWGQAVDESVDEMEGFAHTMSTVGLDTVETTTVTKEQRVEGQLVVVERKTLEKRSRMVSPQMAQFMLSNYRPEKFRRPNRFEHTGKDGAAIEVTTEQGDAAVGALSAAVASIADARAARDRARASGES